MKVHNIKARLHWAMGKLVSLPRDFYCWILLAHSNVARKSNVGEYLAESVYLCTVKELQIFGQKRPDPIPFFVRKI